MEHKKDLLKQLNKTANKQYKYLDFYIKGGYFIYEILNKESGEVELEQIKIKNRSGQ